MSRISNIILKFLDLLEAEGKLFREKTLSAGYSLIAVFIGGLFMFAGCIVAAYAGYQFLAEYLKNPAEAMLISAGVLVLAGLILICAGKRK